MRKIAIKGLMIRIANIPNLVETADVGNKFILAYSARSAYADPHQAFADMLGYTREEAKILANLIAFDNRMLNTGP